MPGYNIILTYEDRETTETREIVNNRPKKRGETRERQRA
jgi:hypothetical protein